MKKIFLVIVLLFAFIGNPKADTLFIDGYETIEINSNSRLFVTDNDNQDYSIYAKWSSSNESIATVNNEGVVTGAQLGKATISAKYLIEDSLSVKLGDVNYDGLVDINDVTLVEEFLNSDALLSAAQSLIADVNNDSIINAEDCTVLQDDGDLGSIDIPFQTEGIALYYENYASQDDLETLTYNVEIVEDIKSVTINELITAFKNLPYYKEVLANHNGNIVYNDNKIVISYSANSEDYEFSYDVYGNIIMFDTGNITSYKEANYAFVNEFFTSLLTDSMLLAAGYSKEDIMNTDYLMATINRNGFGYEEYDERYENEDEYGYIYGQSFRYYADLNHLYFSDDLINDSISRLELNLDYGTDFDFESESLINRLEEQDEVENPSTGITLPLITLSGLLVAGIGIRYYTKNKKIINKI